MYFLIVILETWFVMEIGMASHKQQNKLIFGICWGLKINKTICPIDIEFLSTA